MTEQRVNKSHCHGQKYILFVSLILGQPKYGSNESLSLESFLDSLITTSKIAKGPITTLKKPYHISDLLAFYEDKGPSTIYITQSAYIQGRTAVPMQSTQVHLQKYEIIISDDKAFFWLVFPRTSSGDKNKYNV